MSGHWALKFISGRYQGGEFPLPVQGKIVLGRSSEADMVLIEDMVSRRHSQIVVDGKRIGIMDLGSTNGTFVNGEKVSKQELKHNDRVLVGSSILKVILSSELSERTGSLKASELRTMMEELARIHGSDTSMSGELEEVPLPDLLQLFGSGKKSGALIITGDNDGSVILNEGQLLYAQITNLTMPPAKAFVRMCSWATGHFEMRPLTDVKYPQTIEQSTESLIMDALRMLDESRRFHKDLPANGARIGLRPDPKKKLRELTPEQLDALQLFLSHPNFQAAVDAYTGYDFDAYVAYRELAALHLVAPIL